MERSRLLIIWSTPGAKSDTVDVETVEAEIDVVGMMLGVGRNRKVRLGDAGMWGWEDGGIGGGGMGPIRGGKRPSSGEEEVMVRRKQRMVATKRAKPMDLEPECARHWIASAPWLRRSYHESLSG